MDPAEKRDADSEFVCHGQTFLQALITVQGGRRNAVSSVPRTTHNLPTISTALRACRVTDSPLVSSG